MKLKKLLFAFLFALPFIQKAGAQVVYCEPTFNNGCFSWNNKEITLDSISWTLGSSDCTISDYTTMGTTLTAGLPTPMEVLNGSWCGVGVWVDFDNNGDFDSTENLYYEYTAGDPQTYSFLITIPPTAVNGDYRMRVIAGWGTDCYTMSANGYGACGVYEYGNFVDFRVTVTGGSVGIDENAKNEFAVFPNPASNRINATIKESMIGSEYTIVDQLGKICSNGKFEQSTSSIDISNLTEGIYILNSGSSKKMFRVVR